MYEDKTLICRDCGAEFVFTAGEQAFYAEKGFQNEPSRCKACRDARKANGGARRDDSRPREMYDAICAECGKPTPAGTPKYKCDKCGREPKDPTHPPKFCPECGDPFDDGDIVL